VSSKRPAKNSDFAYTDEAEDEQEVLLGLGQVGAGKTFTAASASKCRKNPGGREAKMTDLEDMIWGEADSKACAGFKHNNLKVRRYNFVAEMEKTGKSVTFVIQKFLELVVKNWHSELKVVLDTLSALDTMMFRENFKKYRNHPNSYETYKQNLGDHLMLSQDLKALNCHLIYLCHGRWAKEDDDEKNMAVKVSGGGQVVPDITGQAPKFYKRDATLQWAVIARKKPKSKEVTRTLLFGVEANEENYEGKNRYEGLLPDSMSPPNLQKALKLIRGGK
jgi:hypothetical protein